MKIKIDLVNELVYIYDELDSDTEEPRSILLNFDEVLCLIKIFSVSLSSSSREGLKIENE